MNGKGSKQRPCDKKKFNDNWDKIFSKKESKPKLVKPVRNPRYDQVYVDGVNSLV